MDYLNLSNMTNKSHECVIKYDEDICDLGHFLKCLSRFLLESKLKSLCVILFVLSTVIMNILVINYLNRFRKSKTVFDRIFIAHAFVDLSIGIFVIPFYLVYTLFGYWPLGKNFCLVYVILDYTLCHVGILHMVFISFARLRSLQHPQSYKLEFLILNTKVTIVCLWLISILIWVPSIYYIMNLNYKYGDCYFTFDPLYIVLQDVLAYLLPMFAILIITFYIMNHLHHTQSFQKHNSRAMRKHLLRPHGSIESQRLKLMSLEEENDIKIKVNFDDDINLRVRFENWRIFTLIRSIKMNAHHKLYVILGTFCVLWLPFCILWPMNAICYDCVPSLVYQISYWMGYAQSLINPILLLILTKPVSDKKSESYLHSMPSELK